MPLTAAQLDTLKAAIAADPEWWSRPNCAVLSERESVRVSILTEKRV